MAGKLPSDLVFDDDSKPQDIVAKYEGVRIPFGGSKFDRAQKLPGDLVFDDAPTEPAPAPSPEPQKTNDTGTPMGGWVTSAALAPVIGPAGALGKYLAETPEGVAALDQATFGRLPQILALEDAARDVTGRQEQIPVTDIESATRRLGANVDLNRALGRKMLSSPIETTKALYQAYKNRLPEERQGQHAVNELHPIRSMAGRAAVGIPQGLAGGVAGSALTGALTGSSGDNPFVESDDPILESIAPHPGGVVGGILGAAGYKAPISTGLATAGATAAFGDKLNMTPAQKLQTYLGAAAMVGGGAVARGLRASAAKNQKAADKLIAPLADDVRAQNAQRAEAHGRALDEVDDLAVQSVFDDAAEKSKAHDARVQAKSKVEAEHQEMVKTRADELLGHNQKVREQAATKAQKVQADLEALPAKVAAEREKAALQAKRNQLQAQAKANREVRAETKKGVDKRTSFEKSKETEAEKLIRRHMSDNSAERRLEKVENASAKLEDLKNSEKQRVRQSSGNIYNQVHAAESELGGLEDRAFKGDYEAASALENIDAFRSKRRDNLIERFRDLSPEQNKADIAQEFAAQKELAQNRLLALLEESKAGGMTPEQAADVVTGRKPIPPEVLARVKQFLIAEAGKQGTAPPKVRPLSPGEVRAKGQELLTKNPDWLETYYPELAAKLKNPPQPKTPDRVQLPVAPPDELPRAKALEMADAQITPPATEPMPEPPIEPYDIDAAKAMVTPEVKARVMQANPKLAEKLQNTGAQPPMPPREALAEGLSTEKQVHLPKGISKASLLKLLKELAVTKSDAQQYARATSKAASRTAQSKAAESVSKGVMAGLSKEETAKLMQWLKEQR